MKNSTWTLVRRPDQCNLLDSAWVFKSTTDTSGRPIKYKARLCARRFRQQAGVDYSETFSPVVQYDSVRTVLSIAAHLDLEMI